MSDHNTEAPTADAEATALPRRPQFVLIIEDSDTPGQLNMAGAQTPVEFDPKSPAHVIGRFFQENIELLCQIAQHQANEATGQGKVLQLLAPPTEVIGEREKTILLPGSDSQAVSS